MNIIKLISITYFAIFTFSCNHRAGIEAEKKSQLQKFGSEQGVKKIADWFKNPDIDVIQLQDELLKKEVDYYDVYDYCKQTSDLAQKKRLILAVCPSFVNDNLKRHRDYYGGILYGLESFSTVITKLKTPDYNSFMDVGSGNGEKLYAALCLGFDLVRGIEFNDSLFNLSSNTLTKFVASGKAEIVKGDALLVNEGFYSHTDLIYMYSPISDPQKMATLFYFIMQQLSEGATMVEVLMWYYNPLSEISGYDIPVYPWGKNEALAIRKIDGKFYYYFNNGKQSGWTILKKKDVQQKCVSLIY